MGRKKAQEAVAHVDYDQDEMAPEEVVLDDAPPAPEPQADPPAPRRRGRKPGSKNKAKSTGGAGADLLQVRLDVSMTHEQIVGALTEYVTARLESMDMGGVFEEMELQVATSHPAGVNGTSPNWQTGLGVRFVTKGTK